MVLSSFGVATSYNCCVTRSHGKAASVNGQSRVTPSRRKVTPVKVTHDAWAWDSEYVGNCSWPQCENDASREYSINFCFMHVLKLWAEVEAQRTGETSQAELRDEEYRLRMDNGMRAARTLSEKLGARPVEPRPDSGRVYYLQVGELVKIGYTANLSRRLKQYPPDAALLAVEPGTIKVERHRHDLLAASRAAAREWYRMTPEVEAQIATVVAEHGAPATLQMPAPKHVGRSTRRHVMPSPGRAKHHDGRL